MVLSEAKGRDCQALSRSDTSDVARADGSVARIVYGAGTEATSRTALIHMEHFHAEQHPLA